MNAGVPPLEVSVGDPRFLQDSFRVLLVEDNPGDARLIAEGLSLEGHIVLETADRLASALDRLGAASFDAVLLDLNLPDSTGFDTIAAILARTRIPILVLTGLDDEWTGLQAIRHGAQEYLVKGRVSDEMLRRSLRYAIERWRLQAALSTPLTEAAPIGLAVLDCELKFLYVNPALAELDGLPTLTHIGQRIEQVVPELGAETHELLHRVMLTGQGVRDVEVAGHSAPGESPATWLLSAVPLRDAADQTTGLSVTIVEITERKRREQALEALADLRRQAQAIGESVPFGIWIAEPGGGMKYLSESFLDLLGMTMEEARDYGWIEALAPETVAPTRHEWHESILGGVPWNCEYAINGADGRRHYVLSRGNAVRDERGVVSGWAGIHLDITDRREADAFRDAFVGIVSHEIRTPITSIYAASTLLGRVKLDRATSELVGDIRDEAIRLRRIVDDLLVLARAERGAIHVQLEPVLVQHVVPKVCDEERSRFHNLGIAVSVNGTIPVAAADEAFIEQVVHNLVTNAAKYGPADGQVEVLVDSIDGWPRVRVLDHGPGVDPAEAHHLFELFYRSSRTARVAGSGIGLFVSHRLIEAIGGSIWAKPREDVPGAEFGFKLAPYSEDDA